MTMRTTWVLCLCALAAGCGTKSKSVIDAAGDRGAFDAGRGDVSDAAQSKDAAADVKVDVDAAPPRPDASGPTDVADAPDADAARAPDAGSGLDAPTDALTFGDSGFSCGRRSFDFEWRQPLPMGQWSVSYGSPSVDTTANELLLPYNSSLDDIALSDVNYALEFDLSIDGNLTFFAGPPSTQSDPPLPSITRSGSDLVLSTLTIGASATQPAGGFQGQHIPAQTVHVTIFVDTDFELFGMKVVAGSQTFWSGFTVTNRPPMTVRVAAAALPGEAGTNAHIHVGPMFGCEVPFKSDCESFTSGFCPVDGGSTPPF
ncbi:MAG TPA: hypothetical protein VH560_16380 [Polyangia bacterium]|nr:hypothetical protein [Polyangia bacterium]